MQYKAVCACVHLPFFSVRGKRKWALLMGARRINRRRVVWVTPRLWSDEEINALPQSSPCSSIARCHAGAQRALTLCLSQCFTVQPWHRWLSIVFLPQLSAYVPHGAFNQAIIRIIGRPIIYQPWPCA